MGNEEKNPLNQRKISISLYDNDENKDKISELSSPKQTQKGNLMLNKYQKINENDEFKKIDKNWLHHNYSDKLLFLNKKNVIKDNNNLENIIKNKNDEIIDIGNKNSKEIISNFEVNDKNMINDNESNNIYNETYTKKYKEFLKKTFKKKALDKTSLLNKIKQINERPKNKLNDQQIIQILNFVKENPNVKNWSVDDVKIFFKKMNLDKFIPIIESNSIDGKKLLFIDNQSISDIFKLTDKNEAKTIGALIEIIKDIYNNEQEKQNIEENHDESNITHNINEIGSIEMKFHSNISEENNNINENEAKVMPNIKEKKKEQIKENFSIKEEDENVKIISSEESLIEKSSNYKKQMNKLGKSEFFSSLNNNSLNFIINYEEITNKHNKVGEGGMGEVYLGEWQGKQVALKRLKLNYNEKGKNIALKTFINELNIISSLRHPNILLYMGATIHEYNYYMITEYLPNDSLHNYLHILKKELTDRQKIKIALQIAIALKYIHSKHILHADLKSLNILLDENFKVKLCDFGFSFSTIQGYKSKLGGTYHWMAPEILNDGKYEASAEIFSFGMIIWEMLTGKTPYYDINPSIFTKDMLKNILKKKFENNEEIVPIPKKGNIILRYIASKCLSFKPEERLSLDNILKYLSKGNKIYEGIDEVTLELYNFVS